nr:MAG TPA: hypothetical protein [Caudoviricetes sp.]
MKSFDSAPVIFLCAFLVNSRVTDLSTIQF